MTLEDIQKLFKFSWSQVFSDHNGKSSVTAITGFSLCCTASIGLLYSLTTKDSNGMIHSLGFATLGAGLLGYRKGVNGKPTDMGIEEPKEKDQ